MLRQEIRQSLRFIVRNPGFSAVAVLSLALGIGANASVFSLADVLLFRPLPVIDPGRVVTIATFAVGDRFAGGVSYPKYRQLRDHSQSFDGLIAFRTSTFSFTKSSADVPQARAGMIVSENFFRVLGVQPMLGRGFLPEDGQASGRNAVVVLDYGTWNDQFNRSTSTVGSNVRINGAVRAGHNGRRVDQRRCRSLTRGWTDRSRSSRPRDIRGGSRSGAVSHHGRVLCAGAARFSGRSDRRPAIRISSRHYRDQRLATVVEISEGNWLAALDDFRNWLIREAA
jgi:MacB-like periplasmic core domain